MTRWHDITYTAFCIKAIRVSTTVFDDDAGSHRPRRRPGRDSAPLDPVDTPVPARFDESNLAIDWRDKP